MPTFASLFSGGGGADIGALQAGYTPLWAVEYDATIAASHTRNLPDTQMLIAPVQDVDYSALPAVDWLHASPPCPNFSVAKDDAAETELDIEMAQATTHAIQEQQPPVFSLEQVYGYRESVSFALIVQALHALHYDVQWWHLNAADYGVPQTRRRLILVARRDGRVVRPVATHCQGGRTDMFGGLLPWVGWYEAIQDIIDTLPDSEFAPWQLARLPADVRESVLVEGTNSGNYNHEYVQHAWAQQAAPTVQAASYKGMSRALLLDGQANTNGTTCTSVTDHAPAFAVKAQSGARHAARAVLVRSDNSKQEWGNQFRDSNDPIASVTSGQQPKAYVGRVVKMTPRALARFQSFPDWYELPERNALACKIIGNAVPPLLMRRVMEAQ
jgi:DNA (cytosine-5)-methyltransferase 1